MKIAAAYIRVSTEEQTELSPDSQLKLLRDYAKSHDMILPDEYIFQDDGISGRTTGKRPGFNKMIGTAKLKPKPFDAILLWKFSRFARNREDSIVYKSMLRKQLGIEVISISENVGDDKMSVLIEAMIEAMDEYYSLNLSEEVKRGMTERVSRGLPVTSPAFGYNITNKEYVPNPDTAPIVKMLFEEYLAGVGCRELAQRLNAMNVKTKRGGAWENRTVEYILQNPVYIGKIRWNPAGRTQRDYNQESIMIIDGHHEPIIPMELWNDVQAKLSDNKAYYRKHARSASTNNGEWMLRSVLRCSSCNGIITRATGSAVQCYKYAHGKCTTSHYCSIGKIEQMVITELENIINGTSQPKFSKATLEKHNMSDKNKSIEMLIAAEERKLHRIKEAFEAGIDTLEEYRERKGKITESIEKLKADLSVSKTNTPVTVNKKQLCELVELLKKPSVSAEDKNKAILGAIDHITFYRDNGFEGVIIFI